jgi:glycosyltransferase involved in cell wall biosynthesis
MISGLTIVRNALSNGYQIAEVIDCLRVISDQIVVLDGYSTDGTYEYLRTQPDIKIHRDEWNCSSRKGLEFARITDLGIKRCKGDYIFYLQADEVLHHRDILQIPKLIGDHNSLTMTFLHIRYDFDYMLKGGYKRAIRFFKNNKVRSHWDAYSFEGNVSPSFDSDINLYHVGYVFVRNILQKMINHSNNFYIDAPSYTRRKILAEKYLNDLENGDPIPSNLELASILEAEHSLVKHNTDLPEQLNRLKGAIQYTLPRGRYRY